MQFFCFVFFQPINISSTSIERAEQIMSQAATKDNTYDEFDNDDIDDNELCRVNFIFPNTSILYPYPVFTGM